MNTCQHCQTELTSPRAKNCSVCNSIKTEAAGNGTYHAVLEAMETAKTNGLTGTAVHQAARQAMKDELTRQANITKAKKQEERERQAAKVERDRINNILRQNGYCWHKETEESMDAFGANAFEAIYGNRSSAWVLTAPDGREVTVKQALVEIGTK